MLSNFKTIDINKTSSKLLKEYVLFKKFNEEYIIFFQIGDFFEIYFQDAIIFSQLTGATLTSKTIKDTGEIPQCGFPKSHIDTYIKKMLDNNQKVCVCKQYYDEENNIYYRQISRKYTQGTIIEKEFLNAHENNFIVAVCKYKNTYNLAYADVSTGQFYKTFLTLEQALFEIDKIEPDELLILDKEKKLFEKIISKYNVTVLNDEFIGLSAEEIIRKYCKIIQKDYCIELEDALEYNVSNFLLMDEITRINLELTRTRRFLKKKGSLFWFINYAITPMGIRLLKKYISEPLLDIKLIKERQKAVEELIDNKEIHKELQNTLENFCDLSRICSRISNSTIYPKDLFQIAKNSQSLQKLNEICSNFNSKLLKLNKNKLQEILDFANQIKKTIREDTNDELKAGGIIKDGYYPNLDYLKLKLNQCKQNIKVYEQKEAKRLDINNLKIACNKTLGYYIEITGAKAPKVSNEYLKKQALTSCVRFTTPTLKEYEQEVFNLTYQINELEYELYCQLRQQAVSFSETIRLISQEVARLDVLFAFAKCAIENNLVKPEFNNDEIFIQDGFHPSLLKLHNELVKNDTNIKNGNMIILTGANMSGKSTYLKHNAIIVLLSQIGSFVPAKKADITLVDKIFLRQGATDDIVNNNSSFMVEMNDLKFIIDNITNHSFIFLDEPAKSTNAKEGGAIARAFCEYLLLNYKTKAIIATHNTELTKIEQQFPKRAINYVIGNQNNSELTISDRKIRKGIINSSLAINTAKLANLPKELIKLAQVYAK